MSFDHGVAWPAAKKELKEKGVDVVLMDGPEVGKVKALDGKKLEDQRSQATAATTTTTTMVFKGNFNGPVFFGYSPE